jgi:hypothetical protein
MKNYLNLGEERYETSQKREMTVMLMTPIGDISKVFTLLAAILMATPN